MPIPTALKVGRTAAGFRVRVEGRGTMRESPAFHAFAAHTLDESECALVVDLTACDYLDSTFLGGLVDLHRRHGRRHPPRFEVLASPGDVRRVLSPTRLDGLLNIVEAGPAVLGEYVDLPSIATGPGEQGRHVMECHRRLAEVEGPKQATFQRIADQLARELVGSRPEPG